MATKRSHNLPDELFVEASLWHARMREPGVSDNDHKEFSLWLNRNPQHHDAYAAVERLWSALDEPVKSLVGEQLPLPLAFLVSVKEKKNRLGYQRSYWGVLAASLLLAVTVGLWWQRGGLDNFRSDYIARTGQRESVRLIDGSQVVLNTDTAIALDFTPEHRTVRLFRGEAYFQVAKDETRPFIVQTVDGETCVVGTEFNVRIMNRWTRVNVFAGRVEVIPTSAQPNSYTVPLSAGEETTLSPDGVSQVSRFDATMVTAWRRGQMVFYRTPLEEVVSELNRYHHGRIMIFGEHLKTLRVTGVFDATKPLEVVDIIERTLNVTSTRLTDYLVFLH